MASHDLKVTSRENSGKEAAKKLRREGMIPAVIYGRKEEPIRLAVNAKELRDLLAHHGSHGLLNLRFESGSTPDTPALIKELQRNPVKHTVQSIDFLRVSLSETVHATVPIVLDGEPVGVKMDGGVLVQALHEIEISALPQNLPEAIHVDVSHLEFNGAPIHIHEVALPEGITAITDANEPIAVVNPPAPEEELQPQLEGDAADVPAEHGAATTGGEAGDDQGGEGNRPPERGPQ